MVQIVSVLLTQKRDEIFDRRYTICMMSSLLASFGWVSPWNTFPFSALTLLVRWHEEHPSCKKLGVALLVVTIWLELYTSYCSSYKITQVLLETWLLKWRDDELFLWTRPGSLRPAVLKASWKHIAQCKLYLGRLPKVDLIILEGKNVRPSVRTSVRPQKVFSIWMKFGI